MTDSIEIKFIQIEIEIKRKYITLGRGEVLSEAVLRSHFKKSHGIYLTKCKKRESGHPDFCYTRNGVKHYLECKTYGDGIRITQLLWLKKNPEASMTYVFIKFKNVIQAKDHNALSKKDIERADLLLKELLNKKQR